MSDDADRPGMLDLETDLAADASGEVRDRTLEQLTAEARRIRSLLDKGLAPRDAEAARAAMNALFAAHQTVRAVWQFKHAKSA